MSSREESDEEWKDFIAKSNAKPSGLVKPKKKKVERTKRKRKGGVGFELTNVGKDTEEEESSTEGPVLSLLRKAPKKGKKEQKKEGDEPLKVTVRFDRVCDLCRDQRRKRTRKKQWQQKQKFKARSLQTNRLQQLIQNR